MAEESQAAPKPVIIDQTVITKEKYETIAERARWTPNNGLVMSPFVQVYQIPSTWAGVSDEELVNGMLVSNKSTCVVTYAEKPEPKEGEEEKFYNPYSAEVKITPNEDWKTKHKFALVTIDGKDHSIGILEKPIVVDTKNRSVRITIHWEENIIESFIISQR